MRIIVSALMFVTGAASAAPFERLESVGGFDEYQERILVEPSVNVSGAICMDAGWCFAVADEGRFAQAFTVEDNRVIAGGRLYLAETKDELKAEIKDFDLEGLAATGTTLIAVGSHSFGRNSCKKPKRSLSIFWGEVDPDLIGTRKPLSGNSRSLEPLFDRFGELDDAFGKKLQENGLNIEGIAAIGSVVFVGFRAPYVGEVEPQVLIAEFTFDALESEDFSDAKLYHVAVEGPPGRGIRGMEVMGDDVILLTGDAGVGAGKEDCDKDSPHRHGEFSLHRWTPRADMAAPIMTLELPDPDWKAEGVLPIDDTGVLIFFDGPPNGAPSYFAFP